MHNHYTPVFDKLCRNRLALGVSNRFLSLEAIVIAFSLFAARTWIAAAFMITVHIAVAILNSKESEWVEILKLLMRLPGKTSADLP